MTRQKLLQLGWEVLIHPSYSPDIALSDFHLFRSLQNPLNGKNFNSLKDCKRHLEQFFAQNDKKFWEDGIMKLPENWQKVVEQSIIPSSWLVVFKEIMYIRLWKYNDFSPSLCSSKPIAISFLVSSSLLIVSILDV